MNICTTIATFVPLLLFVLFGASCEGQKAVTENEIDTKATPPVVKATAPNPGDDGNQLINEAGWELPKLSLFKEKSRREYKAKEIVKIEQTDYVPVSDVIQTADGNTFSEAGSDRDVENKSWLIRYLKVFSADGEQFCYVMRGNLVDVDENGEIKGRLAMSITLVYSDQDGDGRFETFRYSASEAPLIPHRLTEGNPH
jgi:hypothetical protein